MTGASPRPLWRRWTRRSPEREATHRAGAALRPLMEPMLRDDNQEIWSYQAYHQLFTGIEGR